MSEEILRALTELFAILTKYDGRVVKREREYVLRFFQQELPQDTLQEYINLYDSLAREDKETLASEEITPGTSLKDSVRVLGICRRINKTLTQKQKVVVLLKLLELAISDEHFSEQEFIHTVSSVFNISGEEYDLIESFITANESTKLDSRFFLIAEKNTTTPSNSKQFHLHTDGKLIFLKSQSVNMYFARHLGSVPNTINGLPMTPYRAYQFSSGSTIKTPHGDSVYFSDLVAHFNDEILTTKLSFTARIEEYRFSNGVTGLRNIEIAEGPGKLIGIMGASGAGKTTLLNVLAGVEEAENAEIKINGYDIQKQKDKIHGAIGYVPQGDLLIEELTVYENLYFNAQLCFGHYTSRQIHQRTMYILAMLGLAQLRDQRVGDVLNKSISGGQRKRLNIALELMREPSVLFVDEPTSGLSSRDSENVIDLLKELSLKGKLVFAVIHQPSSDLYKMFDKIIIMDEGGYPVYYGNPVDAITYFKKAINQIDSNRGQCDVCGNINPEQIFSILEAQVVNEYGQTTSKRKITAEQWHQKFIESKRAIKNEEVKEEPSWSLHVPNRLKQISIFLVRDILAKASNRQYMFINLLEAPLLAIILTFIIRYSSTESTSGYLFRFNDNIPAFLLMSIIVAMFMGLTMSAEEIIRDRKILKREAFLNLSWNSYLFSKIILLFTFSAIQTTLFVLISHYVLEIKSMHLASWFILFSVSCQANVMGLNISSGFKSSITVYILIPLLLIPQMILSGTMFSFDKLNESLRSKGKVPIIADLMASRWAYEAQAVYQFQYNNYEREFIKYDRLKSIADFKSVYLSDEISIRIHECMAQLQVGSHIPQARINENFSVIYQALINESYRNGIDKLNLDEVLSPAGFTHEVGIQLLNYMKNFRDHYRSIYNTNTQLIDRKVIFLSDRNWDVNDHKNLYFNESLSDLVRNKKTTQRIIIEDGKLIQLSDPVFQDIQPTHILDYRTPFFASQKNLFGLKINTYLFNAIVIWLMSAFLYLTLYFELLKKFLKAVSSQVRSKI